MPAVRRVFCFVAVVLRNTDADFNIRDNKNVLHSSGVLRRGRGKVTGTEYKEGGTNTSVANKNNNNDNIKARHVFENCSGDRRQRSIINEIRDGGSL